jgi:hypothetical protein
MKISKLKSKFTLKILDFEIRESSKLEKNCFDCFEKVQIIAN